MARHIALLTFSLSLLSTAYATELPTKTRATLKPRFPPALVRRDDDCASTFGAGYELCPGSSLYCYNPNDPYYDITSCPGYDGTATASAASSTSTDSGTITDPCYQQGATCVSCFGPDYIECPIDDTYCYNPYDPSSVCEDGSGVQGGTGSATATDDTIPIPTTSLSSPAFSSYFPYTTYGYSSADYTSYDYSSIPSITVYTASPSLPQPTSDAASSSFLVVSTDAAVAVAADRVGWVGLAAGVAAMALV